jgi:hypothetical protein
MLTLYHRRMDTPTSMRLKLRQHGKLTGLHIGQRSVSLSVSNVCLDKHSTTDTFSVLNFYIFRPDFKQAWRIKDTQLTQEGLKGAKGRYITNGEKFFHIPYVEAELVNL